MSSRGDALVRPSEDCRSVPLPPSRPPPCPRHRRARRSCHAGSRPPTGRTGARTPPWTSCPRATTSSSRRSRTATVRAPAGWCSAPTTGPGSPRRSSCARFAQPRRPGTRWCSPSEAPTQSGSTCAPPRRSSSGVQHQRHRRRLRIRRRGLGHRAAGALHGGEPARCDSRLEAALRSALHRHRDSGALVRALQAVRPAGRSLLDYIAPQYYDYADANRLAGIRSRTSGAGADLRRAGPQDRHRHQGGQ